MNKILSTLSLITLLNSGLAAQGVDFRSISFSEALAQSEKEKKPIFLDCYTSWCGPCKFMSENVFPQKEAGDYFNKRFINIKIDMEKGEGIELAKRYDIKSYPTFLILTAEGKEMHRLPGAAPLNEFIPYVEAGLNMKKTREELEKEYNSETINKKDLTAYWLYLRSIGDQNSMEVGKAIYASINKKEKLSLTYWPALANNSMTAESEGMQFILTNYIELVKNVGEEKVNSFISIVFSHYFGDALKEETTINKVETQAIINKLKDADLKELDQIKVMAELASAKIDKNPDQYIEILKDRYSQLSRTSLIRAFEGVEIIIPDNSSQVYYTKLHQLVVDIIENPEMKFGQKDIGHLLKVYERKSHVGVYWEEVGSLEEALELARKENKRVFLDCYTTWCGICIGMSKNVFTQKKVGDYFNENFINVKMDMEKGEGPKWNKRFEIKGYPTFVILNLDGSVRDKTLGADNAEGIIRRAKNSFEDEKSLETYQIRYEQGERDRAFLYQYLQMIQRNKSAEAPIVAQLIFNSLSEEEKSLKENWMLYENQRLSPPGSDIETYLLSNFEAFRKTVGIEKVDNRIYDPYRTILLDVISGKNKTLSISEINQLESEIIAYDLLQQDMLLAYAKVSKLIRVDNWDFEAYQQALEGIETQDSILFILNLTFKSKMDPEDLPKWQEWEKGSAKELEEKSKKS